MVTTWSRAAAVLALAGICAASAHAKFARTWEAVPFDRLLTNVGAYVKAHPKDAQGTYTLGRLHSLAFAERVRDGKIEAVVKDWQSGKPKDVPGFPIYESVQVKPDANRGALTPELKTHLKESVRLYRRAVELEPRNGLFLLGCAWMLEQGAPFAASVGTLPGLRRAASGAWRAEALALYRRAYQIEMPKNLKGQPMLASGGDAFIGIEAGEGIVRLLGKAAKSPQDQAEIARVEEQIKSANAQPHAVTPILVSLRPDAQLADLLAPARVVTFDLAATGSQQRWPWVRPDTGILVWDPERKGRIASGGRLFGSRTWQMFWRNGYEALAALDDNRDGSLTGKELAGIAVWFDRNGNGRSDPGEVVPVADLGIVRLAASASGETDGVPANPRGIELRDGTACPTYDWTPRPVK